MDWQLLDGAYGYTDSSIATSLRRLSPKFPSFASRLANRESGRSFIESSL
jgi:hypothetical protein